jgi:hypothetical protein
VTTEEHERLALIARARVAEDIAKEIYKYRDDRWSRAGDSWHEGYLDGLDVAGRMAERVAAEHLEELNS